MMRWVGLVIAIAFVGVAFGANSSSAHAHAQYVRSTPAENEVLAQAPTHIFIWFSETIELQFSEVQVLDPTGARADLDDLHDHGDLANPGISLRPNLAPGTYTVAWRVLSSVDGHRTAGTFAFSVGVATGPTQAPTGSGFTFESSGSGPPRWTSVLNRWLAFTAMAALIGAVVFPALVLPAGLRAIKPDERTAGEIARRVSRVIGATVIAALAVITVTTLVSLWLQAWAASGDKFSLSAMQDVWTDTRFGDIFTLRVSVLIGAILLSALALKRLPGLLEKWDLRDSAWLCLAVAAVALPLTTSLNSHSAAERSGAELHVTIDWLHLVAGGIWIGGLLQLVLLTPAILPLTERRADYFAGLIPRFSLVAIVSVSVVVGTGVLQWLNFLGGWSVQDGISAVFDSDWGYTLAVKVALLLPLLLLAAFNLLIVRPRFLSFVFQGARTASERILAWERRFRWAVAAEVGFAVAILVVAALLTETSIPTRESAAGTNGSESTSGVPTPSTIAQSLQADDLNLQLDVYPGKAGPNEVGVFLNDTDGDERPIQTVALRFKYLDRNLGENEDFAQPFHPPTHYTLATSQLSLAGDWEIEVIVRREGLLDARGTFTVQVQA
jgi:copper transport protein